jgi:hypothetical protein
MKARLVNTLFKIAVSFWGIFLNFGLGLSQTITTKITRPVKTSFKIASSFLVIVLFLNVACCVPKA